jgi:homoserine dehydrogenase
MLTVVPTIAALSPPRAEPNPFVVKFGSSVLRSVADLPRVAGELYRLRRAGLPVVAVVSALAGETDRLFAEAASVSGGSRCRGVAQLVSQGEERAAALLRIACDRIGLRATICGPEQLGLQTHGDPLSSVPARLHPSALVAGLAQTGLVIVPGFVGLNEHGERTLLGRGGSDFSAIFIGGEIGAECVRLYKDVDGVFDRDPAAATQALHFNDISWADTMQIARPLIQPESVEYAAGKGLPIEVVSIGGSNPTRVGDRTGAATEIVVSAPLRVAIAGYGVVGQALAERLQGEAGFEVVAILVRDVARSRQVPPPVPVTSDLRAFLEVEADITVDALSCEETGTFLCNAVLPKGRHVVSASKRVISAGHGRFARLADATHVKLLYSAAVGGSACILEMTDRARAAGRIEEFTGVLNGTVNFILDGLHAGLSFEEALREAREAGFAEEDCDFDLSGADAATKLRLVAQRAFGVHLQDVEVDTEALDAAALSRIAGSTEQWVQVSTLVRTTEAVQARVTLETVGNCALIATLPGEWNGATVRLADGQQFSCDGRGAGGAATAEAITADLFDIAAASTATSTAQIALAV